MRARKAGIFVTLSLFVLTVLTPTIAMAGSTGRRNTAIAATAAAIYSLAKGKGTQGLVLGAGSYYAWRQYSKARQQETKWQSYQNGHRRVYYNGKHHAKRYFTKLHHARR
ncbi:MAG: hypothetical protein ABFD64_02435 [Armatimonadota bacterium]